MIGAAARQNKHNDLCVQRRLISAWASAQSDQSKKISNDQELISQIPHPALKTKREITKYIN